jgi:hypothetical protein
VSSVPEELSDVPADEPEPVLPHAAIDATIPKAVSNATTFFNDFFIFLLLINGILLLSLCAWRTNLTFHNATPGNSIFLHFHRFAVINFLFSLFFALC